jgi:hypothetical protein
MNAAELQKPHAHAPVSPAGVDTDAADVATFALLARDVFVYHLRPVRRRYDIIVQKG